MSRFLSLLIALSFAFGLITLGCSSKDADADDSNEKQIEVAQIPPTAMDSIKKEIGDAPIKRVLTGQKRGKPYYEAKYDDTATKKRMMVQVAEDGKVYKKIEDDDAEPAK